MQKTKMTDLRSRRLHPHRSERADRPLELIQVLMYLLMEGLQRSCFPDVARGLRTRTFALICDAPGIYECYLPEAGRNPAPFTGTLSWSSGLFLDGAIQVPQGSQSA